MTVKSYKVIEEHLFQVEGLDHLVKGRISYSEDLPPHVGSYHWEISHFCRSSPQAAAVYYPSSRNNRTLEEARSSLLAYGRTFTSIDVTPAHEY